MSRRSRWRTGTSNTARISAISNRNGNSAIIQTVATAIPTPVSSNRIHWGDRRPGSCFMPSGLGGSERLQPKHHVGPETAECHHLLRGTVMSHCVAMVGDALQQLLGLLAPGLKIVGEWVRFQGGDVNVNVPECRLQQSRQITVTESVWNHQGFSILHRFLLCHDPTLWRPGQAIQFG